MSTGVQFKEPSPLPAEIRQRPDVFDFFMQLPGKSFRKVAERETLRITLAGKSFFIKRHFGVGWGELFKNWLSFKRPVVSARNEVAAIAALQQLNIPTTPYVAHGIQASQPASQRSFVVTEDLGEIVTLEDLALQWKHTPPTLRVKRALIRRVAEIARQMHAYPLYHRDFYICHFCFKAAELTQMPPRLHVLDLHRADIRPQPSQRMQLKDLAALYFSAMDIRLSRGDLMTFLQHYAGEDRQRWRADSAFYDAVRQRALKLYAKFQRKRRAGIAM